MIKFRLVFGISYCVFTPMFVTRVVSNVVGHSKKLFECQGHRFALRTRHDSFDDDFSRFFVNLVGGLRGCPADFFIR